jgi:hypothetical protein
MSTDQGRPAEPEPLNDTVPLDLGAPADAQPTIEPNPASTTPAYTTDFVLPPAPAAATTATTPDLTEANQAVAPAVPGRPAPRVGTVVWGLILAVIGVGVIAAAAGARFDVELVSITLLALAGVGLLVGSIATSMRRRRS